MSQKYVIVHFIKPVEPKFDFSFKEWPLHVTLLPNFIVSDSLSELMNKLFEISLSITPFSFQVGKDENFGPNGKVLVSLVKPEVDILLLHKELLDATKSYTFDTPQYIGQGYRPHVTKQVNSQLVNGDICELDSITLVDMYPNNDIKRRKVIKTFYFK